MRTNVFRGITAIVGGTAVAAGLAMAFAAPAAAAPGDVKPLKDRVVRPFNNAKNLLVPDGANNNARIRSKPRTGQANETPESQVWTEVTPAGGQVVLVFQPTTNGGRQLCMDVEGDSKNAGAAVILRPCDGTPSQTWKRIGGGGGPEFLQNLNSGLNMEVLANGQVAQQPFVGRVPANASLAERQALQARNNAQQFFLNPKAFGVGGA